MRKSIFFTFLFIAPLLSFAQYTGPNAKKTHFTVEEVIANSSEYSKKNQTVSLHGYIVEAMAERNMYVFKGRTATINVEIPVDALPNTPFDEKDLVVIIGHVSGKKEVIVKVKKSMVLHVDLEELRRENNEIKMKVDGAKKGK